MARPAKLHDCGAAGMLSAPEIAARAGISYSAVRLRVASGVTGDALVAPPTPRRSRRTGRRHDCGSAGMLTAREIAARAGITVTSVDDRIRAGVTGDALVAPPTPGRSRRRPIPARLEAEIAGMIEEIRFSTKPGARPVYLAASLNRLHRLPRGPEQRLVGYYQAKGFDPEAFREHVLAVYEEARADKLARRRLTRVMR